MGDAGAYLARRLVEDTAGAPVANFVCIAAALSLFYFIPKKQTARSAVVPQLKMDSKAETYQAFQSELGNWPSVCGFKNSSVTYEIYAPHYRPGRPPDLSPRPGSFLLWMLAAACVVWVMSALTAVVIAVAAITTFRNWKPPPPVGLRIQMDPQITCWVSPSGQTQSVPTGAMKLMVRLPHQHAQQEIWANEQENQNSQGKGTIITIYQEASELVIVTGYGDRIVQVVAEFGNDSRGEIAHSLLKAIEFVREKCLREAAETAAREHAETPSERPRCPPGGPVEAFE